MQPIEAALAALESQKVPNIRATAREFSVVHTTLLRRFNGTTTSRAVAINNSRLLTIALEEELINYINHLNDQGLPPTPAMVRNVVMEMAQKPPGKHWVSNFIKRHSTTLKSKYLQGLDRARQKADNWVNYTHYFELVCGIPEAFKSTLFLIDA